MSFVECAARSFTAVSIQKNAPDSSGVYGLSNGCEWIFIGETSNIRARLMEHLNEIDTVLARRGPTGLRMRCACLMSASPVKMRSFANSNRSVIAAPVTQRFVGIGKRTDASEMDVAELDHNSA